jgi:sugar-specific transcriptional regulator TrmB
VLERLGLKGLVSHKTINKIRYFQAVEPYKLHDYIERKEDEVRHQKQNIERIIPQLSRFASMEKRSSSEIFIGEKAIRSAHEILLSNAQQNDVLSYFYPYDDYHETASPFYLRLYRFQKSKKIIERGISTMNFKNSLHFKEVPKRCQHAIHTIPVTRNHRYIQRQNLNCGLEEHYRNLDIF